MPSQAATKENPTVGITASAPWRVSSLTVLANYQLKVSFSDGRSGTVDCSAIKTSVNPGIYGPLANPEFFAQARVELGAVTWPNGSDLDPSWMYDELADGEVWPVPF
jgi:Protein of unknown function (DUF2442)